MAFLPTSIEAHLREVGFTATEILMLRHASDGHPFSVRQLAAKVGKSTGVLDQVVKKLLQKGILRKENINGAPKYMITSAESVTHWVRNHTNEILSVLKRREQDIRLYFSSITLRQNRPYMEYFEGMEGLQKAYRHLLDYTEEELLIFLLPPRKEEDDPLRAFRFSYTKERRRRGIRCRVVTQDTQSGRRYQSRDHFEERQTVLVPQDVYPFQCEQIIAGDTYMSFHHKDQKACCMHFPEFASSQRALFTSLWSRYCTDKTKRDTKIKKHRNKS